MHIVICASSNVVTLLAQWLLHLQAVVTRTAVSAVESTQTILRVHDDIHSHADENMGKATRLYFSQGDLHTADYELYYVSLNSSHLKLLHYTSLKVIYTQLTMNCTMYL